MSTKKIKTSELTGSALDWAVAKAAGYSLNTLDLLYDIKSYDKFNPSTDWAQGGPIIEREIGNLYKQNKLAASDPDVWTAIAYIKAQDGTSLYYCDGPTPLIAACRCYVASKLGDEVEIPEELL